MNNIYARAYTEVLEIISHFTKEEYSKIPIEKINFYKANQDKGYNYKINPEIDLSKQYISKEANAILVSLYRDYFATKSQKIVLEESLNKNQENFEKEKIGFNIFNKENVEDIENKNYIEENQIVKYKRNFISNFVNFIKKLLSK